MVILLDNLLYDSKGIQLTLGHDIIISWAIKRAFNNNSQNSNNFDNLTIINKFLSNLNLI